MGARTSLPRQREILSSLNESRRENLKGLKRTFQAPTNIPHQVRTNQKPFTLVRTNLEYFRKNLEKFKKHQPSIVYNSKTQSIPSNTMRTIDNIHYYHIYNRGFAKMKIFKNTKDCEKFLKQTEKYSKKYNINILSYALMENHFHFLLTQKEAGAISKFMQKLQQSFGMHFNIKYDRRGPVFDSRFKSKIISDYEYFEEIKKYIYSNPIKESLKAGEIQANLQKAQVRTNQKPFTLVRTQTPNNKRFFTTS